MQKKEEVRIGNIYGATGGNHAGMVYDKRFLSPALNTCGGGGTDATYPRG